MPNLEAIRRALECGRTPPGGFTPILPQGPVQGPKRVAKQVGEWAPGQGPFGIPPLDPVDPVAGCWPTARRWAIALRGIGRSVAAAQTTATQFSKLLTEVARVWTAAAAAAGTLRREYPCWKPPPMPQREQGNWTLCLQCIWNGQFISPRARSPPGGGSPQFRFGAGFVKSQLGFASSYKPR